MIYVKHVFCDVLEKTGNGFWTIKNFDLKVLDVQDSYHIFFNTSCQKFKKLLMNDSLTPASI